MKCFSSLFRPAFLLLAAGSILSAADNIPATSADGRVLNLGFEDGTLRDWTATGEAFAKQPVKGEIDEARPFGKGKVSNRQGHFWIGGYEILRDEPKGALTSVAFKVTQPWASFLIGGGSLPGTRVEIVAKDDGKAMHTARGANAETMARSVVDLRKLQGREIFIRIVDEETIGWGHVNFDDFIFHAEEPKFTDAKLVQNPAGDLKPDEIQHAGLPAEKAAQVATVPAGYELKVFAAEPDIINPIAFCMDDRARVWVVEGMTYPQRAKTEPGTPEWLGGADRILVFEDTDGDGKSDKRTVFMEGLNLVSGIEVGFGGVFVGAAPNLIFIPVENWDEPKPGKVEVLLDGWGGQDTHETLNTFKWGPDGWLYGCHGVFTHSEVGRPGTRQKQAAKNFPDPIAVKQLRDEIDELEKKRKGSWAEFNALMQEAGGRVFTNADVAFTQMSLLVTPHIEEKKKLLDALPLDGGDALANARARAKADGLQKQIADLEQFLQTRAVEAGERVDQFQRNKTVHAEIDKTAGQIKEAKEKLQTLRVAALAAPEAVPERVKLNAGIWRYQPQRKEFEVFAHGTSNPWGIDWNADGDLFAEACVIPHLFHIIQGGRYQRQAGQHFDSHTYDDIKTIADHRHYLGEKAHIGNGKSDSVGGGHAHAGLCIPQHPSWPDGIRGNVLMGNIHGARINMDVLERKGSGYVAHHGADFIHFHDKASQIVDLREGPDGTLWMIDWYDLNQCHRPQREAHDYTTGRIFRLGRKGQKVAAGVPLKRPASRFAALVGVGEVSKLASGGPVERLAAASACQRLTIEQRKPIVLALLAHEEDKDDHNLPLMVWYATEPIVAADPAWAAEALGACKIPKVTEFIARRMSEK